MFAACSQRSGLGDADSNWGLIPSETDCDDGLAAVRLLRATFDELAGGGRIDPRRFEPGVTSLEKALEAAHSWTDSIPFTPSCREELDIGRRALALRRSMLAAAGVENPEPASTGLETWATYAVLGVLALTFLPDILGALKR